MQGKTIVFVLVALFVGFLAGFALRPVIAPAGSAAIAGSSPPPTVAEPRATQYFVTHLGEARAVVAGCTAGTVRGGECVNAQSAIGEADSRARTRRFLGERP